MKDGVEGEKQMQSIRNKIARIIEREKEKTALTPMQALWVVLFFLVFMMCIFFTLPSTKTTSHHARQHGSDHKACATQKPFD